MMERKDALAAEKIPGTLPTYDYQNQRTHPASAHGRNHLY